MTKRITLLATICAAGLILGVQFSPMATSAAHAQPPAPAQSPPGPISRAPDPRVEQRTYLFEETNEELPYAVFVSSKVDNATPSPLIISLHGLGGNHNTMMRGEALDLAEEGGYILVGPMGYSPSGWYGSPVIAMGGQEVDPPNLAELSEMDVMNVLAMMREEFNVDDNRIYLKGHSMGGAGVIHLATKYADIWAATAPIAPASFMLQTSIIEEARDNLAPMMIVHGDADTVVPPEQGRRWARQLAELQLTHEYIELEGIDHGVVIGLSMPSIFEYFEQHTR
jgi:poly(3-hydroxybutyrate) depolymerase